MSDEKDKNKDKRTGKGSDKPSKSEGVLDLVTKYRHMGSPFYSILTTPDQAKVPEGKWALSKNKALNMGLWNAIGVASWLLPTSALAAYFTNKWWDKKMRDASKKSQLSRLAAVNPRLTPDNDLNYIANVVDDPNREAEAVERLLKQSNEPESKPRQSVGKDLKDWFGGVVASSLPIAAVPLSMLAAKLAVDKIYSKSMESELEEDRVKIRNLQNAVDYRTMLVQGLVKPAVEKQQQAMAKRASGDEEPDLTKMTPKEQAQWELDRRNKEDEGKRNAVSHILAWPILAAVLGSGTLGLLAFNYLRKRDKDTQTLEFIRKKSLGHNVMQTTPEIGLEQFGIPVDQIVARPGDKNQPGYNLINEAPATVEQKLLAASSPNLLEDLDEVTPTADKKKADSSNKSDALF